MSGSANWALWLVRKEAGRRPFWVQRRICLLAFGIGFIGDILQASIWGRVSLEFDFILILCVVLIVLLYFLRYYARRQVSSDSRLLGETEQEFDTRALALWKGVRAGAAGIQAAVSSLLGAGAAWVFHGLSNSWVFVWWFNIIVGGAIGLVIGVTFGFERQTRSIAALPGNAADQGEERNEKRTIV
jgi:hypothetical protein